MSLERTTRAGLEAVRLANDDVEVLVTASVGPRILGFTRHGAPSIFAELGDLGLDLPDGRRFTLYGGHRLWAAPEEPERTYEPDDLPVDIVETPTGLAATGPASADIGLQKSIALSFGEGASLEVTHRITNRSAEAVELAPWAITQLAPGGTGILPYGAESSDGLQASSLLVGWPYTDFADQGLRIGSGLVLVEARRSSPIKIGTDLSRGWLAYLIGDQVFAKRARQEPGAWYADRGASAQIYCNERFLELETLGPLVTLGPGESTDHVETWSLHQIGEATDARGIPELLGLDG